MYPPAFCHSQTCACSLDIKAFLDYKLYVDESAKEPELGRYNKLCHELFLEITAWVRTIKLTDFDKKPNFNLLSSWESVKANEGNDEACHLVFSRYNRDINAVGHIWSEYLKQIQAEVNADKQIQALLDAKEITVAELDAMQLEIVASKNKPKKKGKAKVVQGGPLNKEVAAGRKAIENLRTQKEQLETQNKQLKADLVAAKSELGDMPTRAQALEAENMRFKADANVKEGQFRRALAAHTVWKEYALKISGMLNVIVTGMDEDKRPPLPLEPTITISEPEFSSPQGGSQSQFGGHSMGQQGRESPVPPGVVIVDATAGHSARPGEIIPRAQVHAYPTGMFPSLPATSS